MSQFAITLNTALFTANRIVVDDEISHGWIRREKPGEPDVFHFKAGTNRYELPCDLELLVDQHGITSAPRQGGGTPHRLVLWKTRPLTPQDLPSNLLLSEHA